jgi:hypothetical protein
MAGRWDSHEKLTPLDRPVGPEDLACTIFDRLGIDPRSTLQDKQGRPVPLVDDVRVLQVCLVDNRDVAFQQTTHF